MAMNLSTMATTSLQAPSLIPATPVNPTQSPINAAGLAKHEAGSSHATSSEPEEELLLKWDDHHKSFFDLAEDLCHQEQFIDVTLSCGEHTFPAHKLVLAVCSPYFRQLFLRNPCKHPIVVLKDVNFKFMKLLLMYMYRGEVSCPQEDLHGLLKTARGLQIRGLVELERKREAEGSLGILDSSSSHLMPSSSAGSKAFSHTTMQQDAASTTTSVESHEFVDDVRSRLHGQLDIQLASSPTTAFPPHWQGVMEATALAHNTTDALNRAPKHEEASHHDVPMTTSDDEERNFKYQLRDGIAESSCGSTPLPLASPAVTSLRRSSLDRLRRTSSDRKPRSPRAHRSNSNAALRAAAQVASLSSSSTAVDDPMSSMNALLAAAQQAQGGTGTKLSSSSTPPPLPSSTPTSMPAPPMTTSAPPVITHSENNNGSNNNNNNDNEENNSGNGDQQGVDLSQAAAVANLQLYYYMQKVASAGMGNPKERKECPICGKTLYDRSTWNRHMRIHTGEKPYPCHFCGRRFRTNYNKLGHEKKCPDRHNARHNSKGSNDGNANAANNNNNNNNEHEESNGSNNRGPSDTSAPTVAPASPPPNNTATVFR